MVEYRHSAHAVYDIMYHVIWVTQYRYKVMRGRVAERARELIRQICEAREVAIVRGSISPDHIYMLLSAPPQLAPAKLVQYIKGKSSRVLQMEFPELGITLRLPSLRLLFVSRWRFWTAMFGA